MQARQNTFGLAFGFGIGRGLVKLLRLLKRIQSLEQDFINFCRRHAKFVLILIGTIIVVLRAVVQCIQVQSHMIVGFTAR